MEEPVMHKNPCALVVGVGVGTGYQAVRRFAAGGYDVAMIARNRGRLEKYATEIEGAYNYPVDITNLEEFDRSLDEIIANHGLPQVVVFNAFQGVFGDFMEIDPLQLSMNFNTNVMAFLHVTRRLSPLMLELGHGVFIVTGNSAAIRGKSNFAGIAPTKAAQRILAESIARSLGPKGIHVAYVVIDAVIDVQWSANRNGNNNDDYFIQPNDIAEELWHIAHQPRGAWSFNVELRPYREIW